MGAFLWALEKRRGFIAMLCGAPLRAEPRNWARDSEDKGGSGGRGLEAERESGRNRWGREECSARGSAPVLDMSRSCPTFAGHRSFLGGLGLFPSQAFKWCLLLITLALDPNNSTWLTVYEVLNTGYDPRWAMIGDSASCPSARREAATLQTFLARSKSAWESV